MSETVMAKGEDAAITCDPDTTTIPYSVLRLEDGIARDSFGPGQNYPNPMKDQTTIAFEILRSAYVSLKVYSRTG